MKYSSGYKYMVREDFTVQLMYVRPDKLIDTWYASLTLFGVLTVKKHFPWDGASGPTWDTKATMTPSCVHDVLAKLIREGHLDFLQWKHADKELNHLMWQRSIWKVRRWYWLKGLKLTGGSYAKKSSKRKIYDVF